MNRLFTLSILLLGSFLFTATCWAGAYGGKVVDLDGSVKLKKLGLAPGRAASLNMRVQPGDIIETGDDGFVEILFDDGNVTSLDESSSLTITRMEASTDGSTESILSLTAGKIKNSVKKLNNSRSRFEVYTHSAVVGVTGTPPWVVAITGGEDARSQSVNVSLLGKRGSEGQVMVHNPMTDAAPVALASHTMTTVNYGSAPTQAADIPDDVFDSLNRRLPIRTSEKTQRRLRDSFIQQIRAPQQSNIGQPAPDSHLQQQIRDADAVSLQDTGSDPGSTTDSEQVMKRLSNIISFGGHDEVDILGDKQLDEIVTGHSKVLIDVTIKVPQ